ncbi:MULTISPECIES: acyl carrier protein [Streptomyces]|uniref:Acyl carrier protein n=1 Tax=Streptomyces mutomycini TaxID=284036 RepID=A0ABW0B3R9_9ACTN|nr:MULTISPECIES: acyl carrier protein [Streptomyces]KPC80820.1 D-alanyl carrier protein [Streptomyces sp. NRRL S-4]
MTHDDARARVRAFLIPQLAGRPLADSDDIFALGYVNSLFAMQLALFLEKEFGMSLGPEDMDFDNFRTVDGLVRLVTSKAAV